MELLKTLIPLLVQLSLGALVLVVGLNASLTDLAYLWRRPPLLAKAVIAISVIVPLAAVAALWLLPLQPVTRVGIMLMAVAPLPPLAPGKQLKLGGDPAYVYSLYVAYAALTVVIVPVTVEILSRAYGAEVNVPAAAIAKKMLISVGLPLVLGMAIRAFAPKLAIAAAPTLGKLSMLLILLVCVLLLARSWPAIASLVGDGSLLAIAFVTVVALVGGHVLGGPEPGHRAALAAAAATRHPGIAMMLAAAAVDDRRVTAAILLYVLASLVVVALYQAWFKRTAQASATLHAPS